MWRALPLNMLSDAKMSSHLGIIFSSNFYWFLLPTFIPWTLKIIVFLWKIKVFFKKLLFEVGIVFFLDFGANMLPFCFQKSIKILPKVHSKMHWFFDRFLKSNRSLILFFLSTYERLTFYFLIFMVHKFL